MLSTRRNTPTTPLRKIKTAFSFSPTASPTRHSDSHSSISSSTSPLSATTSASTSASSISHTQPFSAFKGFAGFTHSNTSTPTLLLPEDCARSQDPQCVIRRKKSCIELEQEEEREEVDDALIGLVEPRPRCGPARGGIEEVLFGKV